MQTCQNNTVVNHGSTSIYICILDIVTYCKVDLSPLLPGIPFQYRDSHTLWGSVGCFSQVEHTFLLICWEHIPKWEVTSWPRWTVTFVATLLLMYTMIIVYVFHMRIRRSHYRLIACHWLILNDAFMNEWNVSPRLIFQNLCCVVQKHL